MTQVGIMQAGITKQDSPLLRRFFAKLVVDVVPAALTSVIGGLLITHYQFNHAVPLRPAAAQAVPATAEMVQLVRDEHAAIMDYLKAEIAAEKSRNAAADAADSRAAAAAKAVAEVPAAAPPRVVTTLTVPAKGGASRTKAAVASLPPHEPLVIAQAEPAAAAPAAPPEPQPRSLFAKTLDIKDHVVGATLHVVSVIGGIPSWFATIGDHGGGASTAPDAAGRSFNS